MIWRQWECFLQVGKHLSYSKAAQNLFLNQSVVSYHIKNLENSLGIQLLSRTSHSVEFTPAGNALYERLVPLFTEIESIIAEYDKSSSGIELQITSTYMVNYKIFNPVFDEFAKIYPNVNIVPKQLEPNLAIDRLLSKEIDACFAFDEEVKAFQSLKLFPLFSIRKNGFLVPLSDPLSKKEEISYRDLRGRTIILPKNIESQPRLEHFLKQIEKLRDKVQLIFVPDMISAYSMASEGKGICASIDFMPSYMDNMALLYNKEDPVSTAGLCINTETSSPYAKELAQLFCKKYPFAK